jgi:O-antigen ligase
VACLGSLLVVGVVGLAASWEHLTAFKRDKAVSVEDMAESAQLRPILATVAWHMFLDNPLLGCGFGQYVAVSPEYLSDRSTELPLEKARPYIQHNVFLGLLTETGIVGLGLFVVLLACWSRDAWQVWRSEAAPLWARQCALLMLGMLGVYFANGMFHNVAVIPMFNMLLFYLAGVTEAVLCLAPADRQTRPQLNLWLPSPAQV